MNGRVYLSQHILLNAPANEIEQNDRLQDVALRWSTVTWQLKLE
jgi:hypothetical protein